MGRYGKCFKCRKEGFNIRVKDHRGKSHYVCSPCRDKERMKSSMVRELVNYRTNVVELS